MKKNSLSSPLKGIGSFAISAGVLGGLIAFKQNIFPHQFSAEASMLEFRWDQSSNYKKLYYFQSSKERRDRSTYYLVMRPKDRKTAILKLKISFPKHFSSTLKAKKFSLCKIELGGMLTKTRCKEKIPAIFEIAKDKSYVEVFPNKIIPSDKNSYSVVMKIFNPEESGMFQLNAVAQTPGDLPISKYLGSWMIDID